MNKNVKKGIVLGLASMTLLSGCGSKTIPTLSNGDEAVVTFNDDVKISANELYTELKDNYGLTSLINMIDKIVLEKKYSDKIEEATSSAQSTIDQIKEYYGDNTLSVIQTYTGYQTIEAYQNYVYLSYLQNLAAEDYAKTKISEKEIKNYYKTDIKQDIRVSHILFSVTYDSDATTDEKTEAKNAAKEKAQAVLDELKNVSKDELATKFSELAKENSDDDATKENGGDLGYINTDTLDSSYQNLVDKAYELSDGEYSAELVETELGYHIVYRTESKEKASLEDVRDKIVDALVSTYLSENTESYVKSMQELRKEYGMDIIDDDLSESYTNYIQNTLLQIQESKNSSSSSN